MKPDLRWLPLNKITHDIRLTPDAHEIEIAEPDAERIRQYFRLQEDFSFAGCPLVWEKAEDELILAANYDLLIALRQIYHQHPDTKIPCTVLTGAKIREVMEFGNRATLIASIDIGSGKQKPLFRRLLSIVSFFEADPSATYEDAKRFFNLIGKTRTPAGEQLRKDVHLAKNEAALCGVLGVKSLRTEDLKPNLANAIYSLEFAINHLIPAFNLTDREDREAQARFLKFDEEYRQYISGEIQDRARQKKDLVKPLYQQVNEHRFADIFEKWSGKKYPWAKSKRPSFSNGRWLFDSSGDEFKIGEFRHGKRYIDRENAKKLVDGAYRSLIYSQSVRSFLKAAGPNSHGEDFRKKSESANNPEFESYRYFLFVLTYKVLYFCDPVLLLRCIDLRLAWFGFSSSDAQTTYAIAQVKFDEWYETRFKPSVQKLGVELRRHSRYNLYSSIKAFLAMNAPRETPASLDEFVQSVFTFVFTRLDDIKDAEVKQEKAIRLALGDATLEERQRALDELLKHRWDIRAPGEIDEFDDGFGSPVKDLPVEEKGPH